MVGHTEVLKFDVKDQRNTKNARRRQDTWQRLGEKQNEGLDARARLAGLYEGVNPGSSGTREALVLLLGMLLDRG